jgi:hypothetical protein
MADILPLTAPPVEDEKRRSVTSKGYLPKDVSVANSNVEFYINRFPAGDIDNFSVCRYAYALGQMRYYGKGQGALLKYAPWETQYYQALDEVSYKAQGDQVSLIDGGSLAPEAWTSVWSDLLRSFSAIDQLPVMRLNVPYRVAHLPKVTGDVTVSYPGENTAPSATQFKFGQLTYTARKPMAEIAVSNEMMRDAPGMADALLRKSTAGAIALDRDTQILTGVGGSQPTGLITLATNGTIAKYYPGATPGANITTTAGHFTPSFNHLSQLRGKVHQLNGSTLVPTGQAHCNGMIAHSRFEQTVLILAAATGAWTDAQGRPLWMTDLGSADGSTSLLGQKWALTNILPTTSTDGGGTASSFIIAGWWDQYALFTAQQVAFETTWEESYFQSDQTGVRIKMRWDGSPIHPEAFAVLAGVDQ